MADLKPDELLQHAAFCGEHGIREPLYLTALRYAGVEITPEKRPAALGEHDAFRSGSGEGSCSGMRPSPCRRRPRERKNC